MRDVEIVTSLISGSANWLSVMRVITVSVNVDLVIVSVTRPSSVGAAGNMGRSGWGLFTFTVTALTPTSLGRATCTWCWLPPLRKCAGIIAWKSSLVSGRNEEGCSRSWLGMYVGCYVVFGFSKVFGNIGFKQVFWFLEGVVVDQRKRNKNMLVFVNFGFTFDDGLWSHR